MPAEEPVADGIVATRVDFDKDGVPIFKVTLPFDFGYGECLYDECEVAIDWPLRFYLSRHNNWTFSWGVLDV